MNQSVNVKRKGKYEFRVVFDDEAVKLIEFDGFDMTPTDLLEQIILEGVETLSTVKRMTKNDTSKVFSGVGSIPVEVLLDDPDSGVVVTDHDSC